MSAYVVQPACIDRIVTFMANVAEGDSSLYDVLDDDNPLQSFERPRKKAVELAKQMHELNVEAVKYRYGDDPKMLPEEPYQFTRLPGASDVQVLKSLGCFLYQCSEGDYDKCSLYKRLDKFRVQLAICIATNLPEWEAAEWG